MAEILEEAVSALQERFAQADLDFGVKFIIEDEGAIMVDGAGVRAADEGADVSLTANAETFQDIISGALDPTGAFMSGRLKIDGDMGLAMRLASILA